MRSVTRWTTGRAWLAVVGWALVSVSAAGCRTERDIQRDFARERLEPTPLAPTSTAGAPPVPVRAYAVRAWVAEGYGVGALGARRRIEAQVERASRLLEAEFGVRLELADVRPWPLAGGARDLDEALRALVATDAGAGASWVIGFVPSDVAAVPGSMDPLGRAGLFGKHLVLRDMVFGEERREIEATLRALPEDERERVLSDRRLHREAVVLIHEWAHTLGAFHERAPDSIMNPEYHSTAYRLTAAQLRVCRLGLERRDGKASGARAAWAREYRAEVERWAGEAWDEATVQASLSAARWLEGDAGAPEASPPRAAGPDDTRPAVTGREPVTPTPGRPATRGVRRELVTAAEQADAADRLGDPAAAWRRAGALAAQLGATPSARTWLCHLQRRARAGKLAPPCARMPELAPPVAAVLFARVLLELNDATGAAAAAARAEQGFLAEKRPPPRVAWAELADVLAEAGACTAAERSAARAPDEALARGAATTCARVRSRALLARGGAGVEAAREPEYVRAVLAGRAALDRGEEENALSEAREVSRAFPGAAGGPWIACVARARTPRADELEAACREAARVAPWASEPRMLLGVAAGNQGRWAEAAQLLREALERDPLDMEVWSRLGVAYEKLGDGAGLEDLQRRHQKKFGVKLAPEW